MYLSLGFRADVKFMIRGSDLEDPAPSSTTDIVLRFQRNAVAESPVCTNDLYPPYPMCGKKPTKMEIIFLDNLVNSPTSG